MPSKKRSTSLRKLPEYQRRDPIDWWFLLVVYTWGFFTGLWSIVTGPSDRALESPIPGFVPFVFILNLICLAAWTLGLYRLHKYPPIRKDK